ncbi:MAG: TonB-dependent receptor [Novosphingobium sp.]
MCGHYVGDPISGAESVIDRLVGGALSQRERLGIYAGEIGTSAVMLNRRTREEVRRGTGKGAVIVGLGEFDKLTLTAGIRYTATRQTTKGCTRDTGDGSWAGFLTAIADFARSTQGLGPIVPIAPGGCASLDDSMSLPGGLRSFEPTSLSAAQKEDNVSWRIGLNYKFAPDSLLYALVSRGYKSGGYPVYDVVIASQANQVSQEQLTSYEAGIKTDLLDRHVTLSAAAFYYDYRDKQFFTYGNVPPLGVVSTEVNIPKSKATGAEADIQLRPFKGLTSRASFTYIRTRIGDYQGRDITTAIVDFKGNSFNYAPEWSGTFEIEYRSKIGGGLEAYVGGNALYNSKTYADLANSPDSLIKAYTVYDARIGIESAHGWYGSLWVRNLTDKYYWTSVGVGSDIIWRYAGLPRTAGATFGVRF